MAVNTINPETRDESAVRERFELIRRMAEDLAHELKNPLNSVVINLEVLRTRVRGGHTDAALERVDVVEKEVRRLHTLLEHMLRLMRPDPVAGRFAVDELVAEVEVLGGVLAKLSRKRFACRGPGEHAYLPGGREALRFALLWLLSAAFEETLAGEPEIRLAGYALDGTVELRIAAPAACAAALREAIPGARRLLAGDGGSAVGEVWEQDGEARVHVTLPVQPDGAPGITAH